MPDLRRRHALAGLAVLAAAPIPFAAWRELQAAYRPSSIRYNALSPQGQSMLALYEHAVGIMKNATADGDPRAWMFQWYTHWVRGDRTKAAELSRVYPTATDPRRALADAMWATCQAHEPGSDRNMFLPRHRMFVYLRAAHTRRAGQRQLHAALLELYGGWWPSDPE